MGFFGSLISSVTNQANTAATNKTNLQIARETNELNRQLQHEQIAWDYRMFNEQNDWNLARRDEEWAYNDPSAQMERLMKAGINPIWAMSNGDAGRAQQLTSASASPAPSASMVAPQMQAPLMNFDTSAVLPNVMNGYLGFQKLALDKKTANAQVAKINAETDLVKSQTTAQQWANNITIDTYDSVVGAATATYDNLLKEGQKIEAGTSLAKAQKAKEDALKEQIIAGTSKTQAETYEILDGITRAWRLVNISQQQANAATSQANTANRMADIAQQNADTNRMNADTADAALSHQIEKDEQELKLKTNEQLLGMLDSYRGWVDKIFGKKGSIVSDVISGEDKNIEQVLGLIKSIGNTIYNRYYSNPTRTNQQAVSRFQKNVKEIQNIIPILLQSANPIDTTHSSVLNYSSPWLQ